MFYYHVVLQRQFETSGFICGFLLHSILNNWPFPNSILKLRPRLISHQRAPNKGVKSLNTDVFNPELCVVLGNN